MKRLVAALAACSLLMVGPVAHAARDAGEPGPGYFTSGNVEWITNVPLQNDTSGAELIGNYFYVTTSRGLTIYDISDNLNPQMLSFLPVPQEPTVPEEDVDTNGKILLIGTLGTLNVIDVEDKTNPTIIGKLAGADNHTISCILDCTYAYGSEGVIVDLRDPTNPKLVGNWAKGTPAPGGGHDITEVAPGRIVTSTSPIMLLDARKDPVHPKVEALGPDTGERYIHGNLWPEQMKDRYMLVGGESGPPTCEGPTTGSFMTWDTKGWQQNHTFKLKDEYRVHQGLPTDGNAPVNQWCAHWFDTNPQYANGGLVAMAYYDHGTRFLNIDKNGKIHEAGWFLPVAAQTSAAYWVTDRILYTVDYQRGFDILRWTGKL